MRTPGPVRTARTGFSSQFYTHGPGNEVHDRRRRVPSPSTTYPVSSLLLARMRALDYAILRPVVRSLEAVEDPDEVIGDSEPEVVKVLNLT